MRATIEFTLPEESAEFELATHARGLASAFAEVARYLRDRLYGDMEEPAREELEKLRVVIVDVSADLPELLRPWP